ncbi:MAG: alpha/beta hydrolase [Rhodospirillaceae bacterium]|nr:alpha/beta hydrolase [Rhodospirillaceae bacterium]
MELTVDGKRVFAATGGRAFDPADPTVIFLHGAGMDHTVWAMQARSFAHHGHGVLAVDLPGHGRSEGPALPSIETLADWVAALIVAAGAEKAALVGHSMGAITALETAARAPERVSKLALLGATAAMPVNDALLNATRDEPDKAVDMIVTWAVGRSTHIGGYRAPGLWVTGSADRLLKRAAPGVLFNDFSACNAYGHGEAAAAAVRCPTLVVVGQGDVMTPAKKAQGLCDTIADARLVAIPGAGHMMMVEKPDECLDALRAFL